MKLFCVADLFSLPPFANARLLCGKEGLGNVITGINIIEAPDVAEWIQGGEVLLTNLYAKNTLQPLAQFVSRLAAKKLGALIVKIGVFVDAIPPEMIVAAEERNLPIIEIGRDVLYRDIAFAVTEKLLDDRVVLLKYIQEVNERFTQLSVANADVQEILDTLAQFIGNPVVLYDKDWLALKASDPSFLTINFIGKRTEKLPFFYCLSEVALAGEKKEREQLLFPVNIVGHTRIRLGVFCLHHRVLEQHHMAIKNAINAITIEYIKRQAVAEVEKRFHSDVLSDLLNGRISSLSTVLERAELLEWNLNRPHVVISFALYDQSFAKAQKGLDGERRAYDLLYNILADLFPDHPIQARTDKLIMLWPMTGSKTKNALSSVRAAMEKVAERWFDKFSKTRLRIGIGDVANDPTELARSFKESEDALSAIKSISYAPVINAYQDLGVYRLLLQFNDRNALKDFIPKAFQQLAKTKTSGDPLLKTLEVYLQQDRNMTHTAEALYVHAKTVAYRIERIKKITGLTLNNADEILHLQLGFKILSLMPAHTDPP